MSGAPRASPYLLLTLAPLFWALNVVIGRAMRFDIPPVAMSFWRWALAGAILLPLVARDLRAQWPVIRAAWKRLAVLGLLSVTLFNTLCYVGLQWTTATNAALFNSVIPVFIVPIAWTLFGERAGARQVLGVLLSLLGVLVIVARGSAEALIALQFNRGDLWLLVAMLLWAFYTVLLRLRPGGLNGLAFLACIVYFGLPPLALAYAWEVWSGRGFTLSPAVSLSFLYFGVFPSILSNLCFNRGVAAVGPMRAGIFVHLMPVFGILLSALLLHETPQVYHVAGMALVFVGIWLSSRAHTGRAPAMVAGKRAP